MAYCAALVIMHLLSVAVVPNPVPAARQIEVKCECTAVDEVTKACVNIDADPAPSTVIWYVQAFEPTKEANVDWAEYCFRKRSKSKEAETLGCDHLKDDDTFYYRGTIVDSESDATPHPKG